MWENTNRQGEMYFAGALGSAKLLLLKNKHTEGNDPGWTLMVAKRPDKRERRQDNNRTVRSAHRSGKHGRLLPISRATGTHNIRYRVRFTTIR